MEFISPTYGRLLLTDVVKRVAEYAKDAPAGFRLIIGTDSRLVGLGAAEFVSAIVVHKIGAGGIYFWYKTRQTKMGILRSRIYQEATQSIELAERLIVDPRFLSISGHLEIHIDVGEKGETRDLIREVVGMVTGNGFEAKTKPEAFGASHVADRHT